MKRICWLMLLLGLGVQRASAFALAGPIGQGTGVPDGYQQPIIAYQLGPDLVTPKNLGEEFRRNTPVMYYTMDANFFDYFGSHGSNAIVEAFELFSSTFTNSAGRSVGVSEFSPDLSEFPLSALEFNYLAQALQLSDIKSYTLNLLCETMGLAEPERYVWTLRDRTMGTPCPQTGFYVVIQRNFDPIWSTPDQFQTSSYVNGTLYSYILIEFCTGPPPLADAVEFPVDPAANIFTAIAAAPPDQGGFFTGLTRDDVGGLRYLYRTNNMNIESAGPDTVTFITNNVTSLLVTSNLADLVALSLTNDAATLQALIPGLVVLNSQPIWTLEVTTNQVAFFTNFPTAPAGSPASLVTFNVFSTNVVQRFRHTFGNVVTNTAFTTGKLTTITIAPGNCAGAPVGTPCPPTTNVTSQIVPMVMGDYYVIPTNLCGVDIVYKIFSNVVAQTNIIVAATNAVGTTNVGLQVFSRSVVTYFTNNQYIVRQVVCPSNTVALRQGIEKVKFVRRDFDSLLNRFFYPVTNVYTLYSITNSMLVPQTTSRAILAPDFLITAADVGEQNPGNNVLPASGVTRNLNFDNSNVAANYPNLAGPGTIVRGGTLGAGNTYAYSKMGPYFDNFYALDFVFPIISDEAHQVRDPDFFAWGSFDGTTNLPVVYPNGTSITNFENSVLIQINPREPAVNGVVFLPHGQVGVDFSTVFNGFSAVGGTPPYTWGLAPGTPGLPPGLTLNPNGTITGAPEESSRGETYDITLRMIDSGGRFVDRAYVITIDP